ncbi:MAG TPA: hypothetical protein VK868_00925 [Pyrinomonadaceae bacterium]|nr:hypothetical protein [Pyrinomonadaceae bacterium]
MQAMTDDDLNSSWLDAMRRGDFTTAWSISDALLQREKDQTNLPRWFQSVWDGTPVVGKRVLVRCYHGLGDTIQFIRYTPLLKAIAAEVIVWVQPSLIPLLQSVRGIDRLLPLHDGSPEVEYEVDLELNELPYLFRTTLATVPADVPYIFVEPVSLSRNGLLRVGLIWQSGDWDNRRSIPFSELKRLAQVAGIEWHILQRDAARAGWDGSLGSLSGGDNPLDDARLMRALDLVISVDTMTAHLAGALGVNTWTLLPFESDWRWMLDRHDSPWYPTMRLFRQREEGKWSVVVDEVIDRMTGFQDTSLNLKCC